MEHPGRKIVNHLSPSFNRRIQPVSKDAVRGETGIKTRHLIGLSLLCLAGIFTIDIYVPLGVASGVAYVVPVLLSSWMPNGRYTIVSAIAGTFLTIAGFLASPTGGYEWQVLSNRALALFVIWFSAVLVHYRRRMEEDQHRLVKEFEVTTEIARVFNSSLNISELYDPISDAIGQLISFDRIHLSLADYESSTLSSVWRIGNGLPGRRIEDKIPFIPFKGSLSGEVVRTRSPIMLEADTAAAIEQQYPLAMGAYNAGLRSFMAIPLIDRDLVVGVLQIGSETMGAYSRRHLALANRIASQIAGAISNSQLSAEHKRLAEENFAMAEIGRIIGSSLDISEVYEGLYQEMRRLAPFDRIAINLADFKQGTFSNAYVSGTHVERREAGFVFPIARSFAGRAMQGNGTQVCHPSSEAELNGFLEFLLPPFQAGLRSFLAVPLVSTGVDIGVMFLSTASPNAYADKVVEIVERIAAHITPALENGRLYSEQKKAEEVQRRSAEENLVMAEIGRIISASLDINEVYDALGEEIQKMIPCDRISLNLVDLDRRVRSTIWVSGDVVRGGAQGDELPLEGSIAAEAVRTRSPIMLDTDSDGDLLLRYPLLASSIDAGFRSFLSVPLISHDIVIGVLRVQSKSLRAYSQQHCDIFERIGNQISGAVASSDIYKKQLMSEERIKASLEEKEVVLREINHRVKNNLQIISSLLNLQSRDIKDEQALHSVQASQDRIRAMAMVHEKLYQSEDLARIDFGGYIRSLAIDLGSSYGLGSRGIDLEIDVENIRLSVDTAIPCGVIVNELVTNSLKHAFPEDRPGHIRVSFQEVEGHYNMIFKDDGIGLPEDLDISQPSSLGLTIVNALVSQLKGSFNSRHNGGCEVIVTFPAEDLSDTLAAQQPADAMLPAPQTSVSGVGELYSSPSFCPSANR